MQYLFTKLEACSSLPSTLCILTMMLFAIESRAASNLQIANSVVSPLTEYIKDSKNKWKSWGIARTKYQETLNAVENSDSKQAVELILRIAEEIQQCGKEAGTKKKAEKKKTKKRKQETMVLESDSEESGEEAESEEESERSKRSEQSKRNETPKKETSPQRKDEESHENSQSREEPHEIEQTKTESNEIEQTHNEPSLEEEPPQTEEVKVSNDITQENTKDKEMSDSDFDEPEY